MAVDSEDNDSGEEGNKVYELDRAYKYKPISR